MLQRRQVSGYGWKPQLPDPRDHRFALTHPAALARALPSRVDLRATHCLPPIYEQGSLGSCTANALSAAFYFTLATRRAAAFTPSRLFTYYNERAIEGTVLSDSGAQLRDGIKSLAHDGAPPEVMWPYDVGRYASKPPDAVYLQATAHVVSAYSSPNGEQEIKAAIATGFPVAFGFTVFESFESDYVTHVGVVPMPSSDETILGGHAVLAVGYDDAYAQVLCRNSWGTAWGISGHFTLPYRYIFNDNLASDFWVIGSAS